MACEDCGNDGQRCCSGSTCHEGNVCDAGICRGCGQPGQRCCPGRSCADMEISLPHGGTAPFTECQGAAPGVCTRLCGAPGLRCCGEPPSHTTFGNYQCEEWRDCDVSTFQCNPCGMLGGRRCFVGHPCQRGLAVEPSTNICQRCGELNGLCCDSAGETACVEPGRCHDGICRCGFSGDPCCFEAPQCIEPGAICRAGQCITAPG